MKKSKTRKDYEIYINKKFGNWTVLDVSHRIGHHTKCHVRCDCGNEKVTKLSTIINSTSKTCKSCPKIMSNIILNNRCQFPTYIPDPEFDRIMIKEMTACIDNIIRESAYYLWLDAGSPEGRDLEFWLAGEKKVFNDAL